MSFGTMSWIQVGDGEPDEAQRFFGELFGWRFVPDPTGGGGCDLVGYPAAEGMFGSGGESVFVMVVEDVQAAIATAEELGGSVVTPPTVRPDGLVFAELRDQAGNLVGVFSPAA